MVDFNDRRDANGERDFANPRGTFSVTSHGYDESDRWNGQTSEDARKDVQAYYGNQKASKTWQESNRLARARTDRQHRRGDFASGADYADAYQDHLVRVMATKGLGIATKHGELDHNQSGYGRI